MKYLLDTNAFLFHLTNQDRLSKNAFQILSSLSTSNDEVAVSVITLMEILYLSEKKRIHVSLSSVLTAIHRLDNYSIVPLSEDILVEATSFQFYELHDRLILATAKWLGIPVISSDRKFQEVKEITVVW